MVQQITKEDLSVADAAVRKWLGRFLAGGEAVLADACSRPARSPRAITEAQALLIVELRRRRVHRPTRTPHSRKQP